MKLFTKIIDKYLSNPNLPIEDRNILIKHIMVDLKNVPLSSIITTNEAGEVLLNGSSLDIEKAKQLREAARIAVDNIALKVVTHEVLYTAVVGGLHKATSPEDLYFYRAAIWFGQQLEAQLKILAQRTEQDITN